MYDPVWIFDKGWRNARRKEELDLLICHGRPWRELLTTDECESVDFCRTAVEAELFPVRLNPSIRVIEKLARLLDEMQGTPVTGGNCDT